MILCENPKKIFNRSVYGWLLKSGYKQIYSFPSHTVVTSGDSSVLHRLYKNGDTHLVDGITGEAIAYEMEVPCGHCACCREKKSSDISTMLEFETQKHDRRPLMVRLSYEKAPAKGLNYRDVQLFLKRLNIDLNRNGLKSVRYALCGEYGTTSTRRPHYHLVIWDLQQHYTLKLKEKIPFWNGNVWREVDTIDLNNVYSIDALIRHHWSLGQTDTRETYGKALGKYIGKYVSKSSNAPDGCTHPFFKHSIKLGTQFALEHAKYLKDNKDALKLTFMDKFTGRCNDFVMPSRYMDKIFPTVNKAIPVELRRAVMQFSRAIFSLSNDSMNEALVNAYLDIFDSYNVILPDYFMAIKGNLDFNSAIQLLDASLAVISDYKDNDYSDAVENEERRVAYYSSVFKNNPVTQERINKTVKKRIRYEKNQMAKSTH